MWYFAYFDQNERDFDKKPSCAAYHIPPNQHWIYLLEMNHCKINSEIFEKNSHNYFFSLETENENNYNLGTVGIDGSIKMN